MLEESSEAKQTNNMPVMLVGAVVGVIVLGIVGYAIISSNQSQNAMETQSPIMVDQTTPESIIDQNPNVEIISVEAGSFYFEPNEIRVKKDQKIRIELNSVSMMHDFVIDKLNVSTEIIQSGDTGIVEFTPDQTGEFEFYCSVGNHRQLGMVGKLIVE